MEKLERSIKKINKKIHSTNEILLSSPRALFNRLTVSNDNEPTQTSVQKRIMFDKNCVVNAFSNEDNNEQSQQENDKSNETVESNTNSSIGLSYLPLQIQRNFIKHTFSFTLMVSGQSGLGKSTFINSMFFSDIYNDEYPGPTKRAKKTLTIDSHSVLLNEGPVNVLLTIVDTPGFGDSFDNTRHLRIIKQYIEQKYSDFLESEFCIDESKHFKDERIHCCLYFLEPTGHSLKQIDLEFMKHLHEKVNLIPIIAKADALTPEELIEFKSNIIKDLKENQVKIYQFTEDIPNVSSLTTSMNDQVERDFSELKKRVPFAIVASNYVLEQNGQRFFGRKYPWGIVNIENLDHCDFKALRELLIKHYMYELVDHTHRVHYENYRRENLKKFF